MRATIAGLAVLLAGCATSPSPVGTEAAAVLPRHVLIPAGEFWMGSPESEEGRKEDEGPRVKVTITVPYLMAETPVTVAQFEAFTEATGYRTVAEHEGWSHVYTPEGIEEAPGRSWRAPGFEQGPDHPAVCLHIDDMEAYCAWATTLAGATVRLPTEAEWEHACRAGTETAWWWGDDVEGARGRANLADLSGLALHPEWEGNTLPWDDGFPFTSPVRAHEPNPWGLHDMHGNVWEVCADWYAGPHEGGTVVDPRGPGVGDHRVRRGGSWMPSASTSRSSNRGRSRVDFRVNNRGFRTVIETRNEATSSP